MPKNWGENSKAAEAKQRKDAVKREETERKQKEKEDKLWEDNDKHVQRKMERKEEKDKKLLEKLQRKQEASKLLEEEMSKLKSAKPERVEKVSHFDLHTMREREAAAKEAAEQEKLMGKHQSFNLNFPLCLFSSSSCFFFSKEEHKRRERGKLSRKCESIANRRRSGQKRGRSNSSLRVNEIFSQIVLRIFCYKDYVYVKGGQSRRSRFASRETHASRISRIRRGKS
jgi:hypothetical protein